MAECHCVTIKSSPRHRLGDWVLAGAYLEVARVSQTAGDTFTVAASNMHPFAMHMAACGVADGGSPRVCLCGTWVSVHVIV